MWIRYLDIGINIEYNQDDGDRNKKYCDKRYLYWAMIFWKNTYISIKKKEREITGFYYSTIKLLGTWLVNFYLSFSLFSDLLNNGGEMRASGRSIHRGCDVIV